MSAVTVVGGGLAGSEAAWQLAQRGIPVKLYEMRRPGHGTEAHRTDRLAELVCSNSFRCDDRHHAVGLLHEELRRMGSLIMAMADRHAVPAGSALAVDRDGFSEAVETAILGHPLIELVRETVTSWPDPLASGWTILATGPLTAGPLAEAIVSAAGQGMLSFFDAIAPIVLRESIDMDRAWYQSRYDKVGPHGTGKDYINCPMRRSDYEAFIDALLAAESLDFKAWEKDTPYFNGCLPIEVMASRGRATLAFGPMKPVGLTCPHPGFEDLYAVVQLRQDNALGTLYNMVGFQTKMKYGPQAQVFRMIPGLENAEFMRLGGMHRNSFLRSPVLLSPDLSWKTQPRLRFAGQITGVEGYVESTASGLLVGLMTADHWAGRETILPPPTTALGSLLAHVTGGATASQFQPMNMNFGLMPPLPKQRIGKSERGHAYSARALEDLERWKASLTLPEVAWDAVGVFA